MVAIVFVRAASDHLPGSPVKGHVAETENAKMCKRSGLSIWASHSFYKQQVGPILAKTIPF